MPNDGPISPTLFDIVSDFVDGVEGGTFNPLEDIDNEHPLVVFAEAFLAQFGNFLGRTVDGFNDRSYNVLRKARNLERRRKGPSHTRWLISQLEEGCTRLPEIVYESDEEARYWLYQEFIPELLDTIVGWVAEVLKDDEVLAGVTRAKERYEQVSEILG